MPDRLRRSYFGTALGVIFTAFEQGKIEHVWVDETRPVNQGGRLTAWELRVAGIPSALITDNMAASVMKNGWVDAVIVGADRICANGDTANKIGTYGLAVLAKEHGIPFYVAAPSSTVDLTIGDGSQIEIEERDPREVEGFTVSGFFEPDSADASRAFDLLTKEGPYEVPLTKGHQMVLERKGGAYSFDAWFKVTPPGVQIYNPAFDVTPAEYITAIITERGVDPARAGLGARYRRALHGRGQHPRTRLRGVGHGGRRPRVHDPDVRRDRRNRRGSSSNTPAEHCEDARPLNTVIIYVGLPAFIFEAIHGAEVGPAVWRIVGVAWAVFAVTLLLAFLAEKVLRLPRDRAGGFLIAASLGNTGYLGYPLTASAARCRRGARGRLLGRVRDGLRARLGGAADRSALRNPRSRCAQSPQGARHLPGRDRVWSRRCFCARSPFRQG